MKNKPTRRKAINCNMVKASESNPGYFKYIVTIQEPMKGYLMDSDDEDNGKS